MYSGLLNIFPPTKIFKTLCLYLNNGLIKGLRAQFLAYRFFSITPSWARQLSYELIDLTNGDHATVLIHIWLVIKIIKVCTLLVITSSLNSVMPDIGVLIFWEYICLCHSGFLAMIFNVQLPRYFFGVCVQNPERQVSGYLWTWN